MSSTTWYDLHCACGHQGQISMSENDAPFSRQWEEYQLHNLRGAETDFHINGFADWNKVFSVLKPKCPACGHLFNPNEVQSKP